MTPKKCARLGCDRFTELMYKVTGDLLVPLCEFHVKFIEQESVVPWGSV